MHVRATVFYENLRAPVTASLAAQGKIRLPWGSDKTVVPLVADEDVARVAAGLLTSSEVAAGATYALIGAGMCATKRSRTMNGVVRPSRAANRIA